MKKALFLVAVATLFFSCQRENTPSSRKSITFKASIEELSSPTKAVYDDALQFVWSKDDKIGIYVNDSGWSTKNQPFTLEGDGGAASGNFAWDYGDFTNTNATAAFFPWQGTGSDINKNHVDNGTVYFKLQDGYYDYTSAQMLTPLVAPVTYADGAYDPIEFKHAGAAVKLTIANLPAKAHSIGMWLYDGQQVWGAYSIPVSDAGTAAITADVVNTDLSTVWLNFDTASEEREFTFIFPVPPLTAPKLAFWIYDVNDVCIWETKLKAQSSDLGRGDMLVFRNPVTISYYKKFKYVSSEWTVVGDDMGWDADIPMITDDMSCIAKGLSLTEGSGVKVRKDKAWFESYGEGNNNKIVPSTGVWDVIFDLTTNSVTLAPSGECPYPGLQNNAVTSVGFTEDPGFDNSAWAID